MPVERSHGEGVVLPLLDSELFCEVSEGIKGVASIELFVILAVTAFRLPVMPWGIGADFLCRIPRRARVFSESVRGLLFPISFVNSNPLSVWTHSIGKGNFSATRLRNCVDA